MRDQSNEKKKKAIAKEPWVEELFAFLALSLPSAAHYSPAPTSRTAAARAATRARPDMMIETTFFLKEGETKEKSEK
jgi:hypothetical protein